MESEQATPVDSIKDVVWSSVKVPEFDKHQKKAGGHIGQNVVEITIKMKTIVQKPLMIKSHNTLNDKNYQTSSQKIKTNNIKSRISTGTASMHYFINSGW